MKIKLDENLGQGARDLLRQAGLDVATVHEQNLSGASDHDLARHCADEARVIVTLDLDFTNPVRFPLRQYAGIVVLRSSGSNSKAELLELARTFAATVASLSPVGRLWIIEPGRVREYKPDEPA
jgi:predicted nuclease of predicted toxin-antitoxin system